MINTIHGEGRTLHSENEYAEPYFGLVFVVALSLFCTLCEIAMPANTHEGGSDDEDRGGRKDTNNRLWLRIRHARRGMDSDINVVLIVVVSEKVCASVRCALVPQHPAEPQGELPPVIISPPGNNQYVLAHTKVTSDLQSISRLSPNYQGSPAQPTSKMVGHTALNRTRPRWVPQPPFLADMLEESELASSRIVLGDLPVAQLATFGESIDIANNSSKMNPSCGYRKLYYKRIERSVRK